MYNCEKTNLSKYGRAIVIGGSIAGLLVARVLADYFETVTIVERDKLLTQPQARKGVPQSVQPHVLFAKGYQILEQLFPNLGFILTKNGALKIDWVREFHHFNVVGWSPNANGSFDFSPSKAISFTCSRPLLEWTIRQQLGEFQNVRIVDGYKVTQLLGDATQERVTGVLLRSLKNNTSEEFWADLVVDASGRSSQSPKWLANLGFSSPSETVINPLLGYATRHYKAPENFEANWKIMLISQAPPHQTRLGYLAKIENGEWIATLGGYGGDFPPTDDAGFLKFASSLRDATFYDTIRQAHPVSPIYAHRATANRLRHFDRVKLPQGFIALGDAVCALCPVYGQGMTVSALAAMVLQDCLRKNNLQQFQKNLAKEISFAWTLATMQDSRFPTTVGAIPKKVNGLGKIMQWYTDRLLVKATVKPSLHALCTEVFQMLRSPLAFYHPSVVWQVLTKL